MHRWLGMLLLVGLFCGDADGAGSSTKAPAGESGSVEDAIRHFNQGIRHRNKAWDYEQKAEGVAKAEDRKAYDRIVAVEYEKAKEAFQKAISADKSMHQAHGSMGYVLRKLGDFEGALKAYATSLELKPDYDLAIEYRGEAYLDLDRLDDAFEAYERLKALDSRYASALVQATATWVEIRRESGAASAESMAKAAVWLEAHEVDLKEPSHKEALW